MVVLPVILELMIELNVEGHKKLLHSELGLVQQAYRHQKAT